MRATTCTVPDRAILQSFIEEEKACQVKVWFSRVPTSANVSDAPSRLDTGENGHLRCYQSVVSQSTLWDMLGKSRIETLGFRRRDPAMRFPNCKGVKKSCCSVNHIQSSVRECFAFFIWTRFWTRDWVGHVDSRSAFLYWRI